MFEKLFLKEYNLRKHLDAPLSHEREAYIAHMEEKGYCLRYLQIKATYLLYAVNNIKFSDLEFVTMETVANLRKSYEELKIAEMKRRGHSITFKTKANDLVCAVLDFLVSIGKADPRYTDVNNLFNILFKDPDVRLRYFSAPLYQSRLSFLSMLQSEGMVVSTIREYAETQLHIIDTVGAENLHSENVTEDIIVEAWNKWDEHLRKTHNWESHKRKKTFFACAHNWLGYAGLLKGTRVGVPHIEKVEAYCNWTCNEKGFADGTICSQKAELVKFVTYLHKQGKDFYNLIPSDIDDYLEYRHNCGCNRRTIATIVTSLRGFARYTFTRQWIKKNIAGSIRSSRLFAHETLPYAPKWKDVEKIAGFYNDNTPDSIRSRAIIMLLVVYGFRSSEVVGMMLEDIDWKNDLISVRHIKRGRTQSYPLIPLVGNAIASYLGNSRNNSCKDRHLFLTERPPYTAISRCIVYQVVSRAYKQLNVSAKHIGGHSLRHACASRLINSGETLKTVSDVLGHRSMNSTKTYAKINLTRLAEVADMEWEGLL